MTKPKTVWHYSLATETDRIIQAAANTFNRFYSKYGFLVLPYRVEGDASTVFLPNLKFKDLPGFIKKVSKIEPKNIPVLEDESIYRLIKKSMAPRGLKFEERKIQDLKRAWRAKEKKFWQLLIQLFPQLSQKQIEVEIRPTSFGTATSFNSPALQEEKVKLKLYIRVDQSAAQIAEGVLSSIFTRQVEKEGFNWEEREATIDFLLEHTRLKTLFPDYQPTLKSIRKKERGKLVSESQKYLKELGMPTGEIFSIKEREIIIDKKTPFKGLTKKEDCLLRLLVENKNRLCSLDQIGDALWGDEAYDSFSVWAIGKLVQRLRKKLQAHGLSPTIIQVQRGRGYLLRD